MGDQGLFAGAHFFLNILLARWISPEAYGAFAIVYSAFLVLVLLHDALLIQPLLVFGPEQFQDRFPTYLRTLSLWGNSGLAVAGGLFFAGAGTWFGYAGTPHLAAALMGCAAAQPFILFLWLMRRATYVRDQQHLAVGGGAAYAVLVVAALYALRQWAAISAPAAFAVLGGAGLVVGTGIMKQLGVRYSDRAERPFIARALQKHWNYGRWAAGTGVMIWAIGNIYILLLPVWKGLEASGALRALMNLIQPALHIYMAFSVLLIPEFVKAQKQGLLKKKALSVAGCFLTGGGLYWLLAGLFGSDLVTLLYGDGKYSQYSSLFWFLGALPFVDGAKVVLEAALRAIEQPDWLFWAYVGATVLTLTVGVGLTAWYGLIGAALGLVGSSVAVSVGALYFLLRVGRMEEN